MVRFIVLATTLAAVPALAQPDVREAADLIRLRLEAAPIVAQVRGERVHSRIVLPQFYLEREFRPAWFDERGFRPQLAALVRALNAADAEGLRPDDYHAGTIARLADSISARRAAGLPVLLQRWVDLDLLLTDAYLIYASHLVSGRLDPESKESIWGARGREVDIGRSLRVALDSNRVEQSLQALLPKHEGYRRLRSRLGELRAIEAAGGWPRITSGPTLRAGDRGARVASLRARLVASGDLGAEAPTPPDSFDATLAAGVRRFQRRHGLPADGVVGPATIAAANIPAAMRIRQLQVNMERWRWLPQSLGDRYLIVNIAGFDLRVVESERPVMKMPVVVGRPYRMTPLMADRISYLVLSPTWTVPRRIAVEDKLPVLRRDPAQLQQQGMRVLRSSDMREVDPATVDWAQVRATTFPYVLRQDPGPQNALGPVKFMFPNPFDVYLHGTPSQELFSRDARAFSSGCIRLEQPLELAELLLRDQPAWTRDAIDRAATGGVPRTVTLRRPVPVHLLYWTAWAEDDGTVHVRPDVYDRDGPVAAGLAAPPPGPFGG